MQSFKHPSLKRKTQPDIHKKYDILQIDYY
jgi:hypothetical protein